MKIFNNKSSYSDILDHLTKCSNEFVPPLHEYVDLQTYAKKISEKAERFEFYSGESLEGLLAVYSGETSFITNVSVDQKLKGMQVAQSLLKECVHKLTSLGCKLINLEVFVDNKRAINFYLKNNFRIKSTLNNKHIMSLNLRDYNAETNDTADHKYAYDFDFDIMHRYMMCSFQPFFRKGSCLELGSYKGDFTKRLLQHFDRVTCVDAASDAVQYAKEHLGDSIECYTSLFEYLKLPTKYENVILTHVLEHIDNPTQLLSQINTELLSSDGYLFVVCPNANAPSRQIAVKMGIIPNNTSITDAEKAHGHRITYTLDTLERDIKLSGLEVVHRSGIFFKALANYQWDKLMQTDIISPAYLDGCYQLGQHYPDLCSSIFFVCKAGNK